MSVPTKVSPSTLGADNKSAAVAKQQDSLFPQAAVEEKPKLTRKQKFQASMKSIRQFLWNSERKEFMGRGCFRWALLCTYYILFYITLFTMGMALFAIFLLYQPENTPNLKWNKDRSFKSSLIQQHPAVVITPAPNTSVNFDSPMIWINGENGEIWGKDVSNYVQGLQNYAKNHKNCEKCPVPDLGSCLGAPTFGFKNAAPVFIFGLSKIIGYEPELFSSEAEVDEFFKQFKSPHIQRTAKALGVYQNLKQIYILCHGETVLDQAVIGSIQYCSKNYVLPSDFPFNDRRKGYLAPTVAITFPKAIPGIPFAIECYPVLKGLKIDKSKGVGYNRLEVMLT